MQIEIAKSEKMAQTGSSLLRMMQNESTPTLDLLVRESIQNSLDASNDNTKPVEFDISKIRFKTSNISNYFSSITEKLDSKYPGVQESLVITDKNTTGLTGPLHHEEAEGDNLGNLINLVYEISRPQEKLEAGGSWGIGKTIYFRAGMGLVIYYTRIKDGDKYQSRLVACLIEDEKKEDLILPDTGKPRRGIAWWGEEVSTESNETKPVTDSRYIEEFLLKFGLQPFDAHDTGTKIIIPFINEESLLIKPEDVHDNKLSGQFWYRDIDSYLQVAIQRWYAPRINNLDYPYGSYLKPSINGNNIEPRDMEPLYQIIRSLYIFSTTKKKSEMIDNNETLASKNIEVHRDLDSPNAGNVTYIKVTNKDLRMVVPFQKPSPFSYIDENDREDQTNPPIVTYVRKPGLIINYEVNSDWTKNIEKTKPDEYIIAIFVPNSDNKLKPFKADHSYNDPRISLDEYLRRGEKADHATWNDITDGKKFTIVKRIKDRTAQTIKDAFNVKKEERPGQQSTRLGMKLAEILLPPTGYGHLPSPKKRKPTTNNSKQRRRKQNGGVKIDNLINKNGLLQLTLEITPKKQAKSLVLEPYIESEGNKKIKGNSWEEDIGTAFPIHINSFSIPKEQHSFEVNKTDEFNRNFQIRVFLDDEAKKFHAYLTLEIHDQFIQPSLEHRFEVK